MGFGHGEAGPDVTVQQRLQPTFLLGPGSVQYQGLHVAGVRRIAVEHLRRPDHASHDFGERGILEIAERFGFSRRRPVMGFGKKEVPETLGARFLLEVPDDGRSRPGIFRIPLPGVHSRLCGVDMAGHEGIQPVPKVLDATGVLEIHRQTTPLGLGAYCRGWRGS